jgi:hypothetical protein
VPLKLGCRRNGEEIEIAWCAPARALRARESADRRPPRSPPRLRITGPRNEIRPPTPPMHCGTLSARVP